VACLQQTIDILVIEIKTLSLVDGFAVKVQTEPAHGSQNGVRVFLFGALRVRVFNAQQETAAEVPGQKPAENSGARAADVQVTGGAGREAGDNGCVGHALS
jgi:hypothetical protein